MTFYRNCFPWIAAIILCISASVAGATDHSGVIEEDDYWVAAGNPHVIIGTVTVAEGVHLLIGPGVEVWRANQYSSLRIEGALTADGDPGNEVLFTADAAWAGSQVTFNGSGSGGLEYCIIEKASTGVTFSSPAVQVSLFGSTVRDCGTGIYANGGSLRLASTTIINNRYGLHCRNVAPTLLDHHVMVIESEVGVWLRDVANLNLAIPLEVRDSTSRGIWVAGCSLPVIDNVTLTGNAGYGALYFENCGDFMLGAGNVIGGAGQENSWPVTIELGSYPADGCIIPATGNTNNNIQVYNSVSSANGTWRKLPGLDYVVTIGDLTVSAGGTLTIEPGVTIRNEHTIFSTAKIIVLGSLLADGTPGQEIIFTREDDIYWGGISFGDGGSGSLTHCIIEQAVTCVTTARNAACTVTITDAQLQYNGRGLVMEGGTVRIGSASFSGAGGTGIQCDDVVPEFLDEHITITGGTYGLSVRDVPNLVLNTPLVIRGATQAGVYLVNCLDPVIDNLVVSECTGYGAFYLDRCGDFTLGSDNVIGGPGQENSWPVTISADSYPGAACIIPAAGNTNNDIHVYAGASTTSGTWRKFADLDYIVDSTPIVSAGDTLTIAPDVQVRFGYGGLDIAGELLAVGTPGQVIVFTRNGTANWTSLNFSGAGSGTLDHCIVEYASNGVYQTGTGTVTITDSILRNGGYGVRATSGTVELSRNVITGNTEYGVYLSGATPVFGNEQQQWNDIFGNGNGRSGRGLRNGTSDINAHYVYWGTTDAAQISLAIQDRYDDPSLGIVDFLPYCDADHEDLVSGVGDQAGPSGIPARFALAQNAPNPFNPSTMIRFDTTRPSAVRLSVFNIAGDRVATLLDGPLPAGRHEHTWNGCDDRGRQLASGVYFYRIETGEGTATRRLAILK